MFYFAYFYIFVRVLSMFFRLQLFIPAKLAKFDKVLIIFVHKKYVSGTQEANRYKLNLKK